MVKPSDAPKKQVSITNHKRVYPNADVVANTIINIAIHMRPMYTIAVDPLLQGGHSGLQGGIAIGIRIGCGATLI